MVCIGATPSTVEECRSRRTRRRSGLESAGRFAALALLQEDAQLFTGALQLTGKHVGVAVQRNPRGSGLSATEADWRLHLEDVRAATTTALAGLRKLNEGVVRQRRARLKSLEGKREKFLEAFYADALPADLLKSEQDKIATEMDEAKRQLAEAEADVTGVANAFNKTLDAVERMVDTYREARDIDRRLWNQALFECFRVYPDEGIEGELREEVQALTDGPHAPAASG